MPTSCCRWGLTLLPLALLAGAAQAQGPPGDPHRGQVLAERWCVYCHEVEAGSRQTSAIKNPNPQNPNGPAIVEVPAFQAVADDPAVTEVALRAFQQTPHANMPDVRLPPDQIDDLIAYLLTLKGQRSGTSAPALGPGPARPPLAAVRAADRPGPGWPGPAGRPSSPS
jgi:mono/diheme cytochrome c family protein